MVTQLETQAKNSGLSESNKRSFIEQFSQLFEKYPNLLPEVTEVTELRSQNPDAKIRAYHVTSISGNSTIFYL